MESDWIWICLSALWERWFPEQPGFELLDDKMQSGYDLRASGGAAAACRIWLEAWNDVLGIFDKSAKAAKTRRQTVEEQERWARRSESVLRVLDISGMQSIREFDQRFGGTQSLFNWIQDLEDELRTAGREDRQFLTARIAMCEEGLRRFRTDDELLTENRRRALAESYFELGETASAEALYRGWLDLDPCWGWGWIGWSDCYRFTRAELRDEGRREQLLREGLAIAEVRDRSDLIERLADLCAEQGRVEEAKEFRRQAKRSAAAMEISQSVSSAGNVLRQKTKIKFGGEGLPLSELSKVSAMLREAPSPFDRGQTQGRAERPVPVREREEVQEMLRFVTPAPSEWRPPDSSLSFPEGAGTGWQTASTASGFSRSECPLRRIAFWKQASARPYQAAAATGSPRYSRRSDRQ